MGTTPDDTTPDLSATPADATSDRTPSRQACGRNGACHTHVPMRRRTRVVRALFLLAVLVGIPFLVARAAVHCHERPAAVESPAEAAPADDAGPR